MADLRRLSTATDDVLADALRGLGASLATPSIDRDQPDPAMRARMRIQAAGGALAAPAPRTIPFRRPLRRGAVLALAAALVLAALAGAIGLGLPGLRIVPASPGAPPLASPSLAGPTASASLQTSPTPSPTPGLPGSALQLGRPVTLDAARAGAPYAILLPSDPSLGPPDAVWIDDLDRVSLVWTPRPGLPPTLDPTVGLVVSEMPGHIERGYFEKLLAAGSTIEPVTVAGRTGYWISGEPHEFVYVGGNGEATYDSRRLAGDTVAWSTGDVTYRVESSLGRDATIRLADTLR